MTDGPTLGEVIRRLDETSRRLDDVSRRVDAQSERMEARYVAKGEYEAHREADARRFQEIEDDLADAKAFKRQVGAGVLIAVLGFVAQAVITITVLRGGA